MRPAISIIVTCFNREATIQRALNSLFEQTFKDFEIIIVDDCSTDNSRVIIKNFKDTNPKLKISTVLSRNNMGQSASINKGVRIANGVLISFLDSDDIYRINFLEEMVSIFESNKYIDFAYCRFVNGPAWSIEGNNLFQKVLRQGYLSGMGTLVSKREVILEILPLPERVISNDKCNDDYLCFELARKFSGKHVPIELYEIIGAFPRSFNNKTDEALGWRQFYFSYRNEIISLVGYYPWAKHLSKVLYLFITDSNFNEAKRTLRDEIDCRNGIMDTLVSLLITNTVLFSYLLKGSVRYLIRSLKKI